MTAESYLSICSHRALKSYENSNFNQVFEITTKNEALGVYKSDGVKIKGQDITEFDVAIRERPTNDKPAYSMITVTYRDFEEFEDHGVIVKQDWDISALDGVYELRINVVSATSTDIVVNVYVACGDTSYEDIVVGDWELLDANGTAQTIDTSAYNETTMEYTISGTAFVSGSLGLDGVVQHGEFMVQASHVPVTIV